RADGDAAVAHCGNRGHHGAHGKRFLAVRDRGEHARDHRVDAVRARAGPARAQGRGGGAFSSLHVRDFQGVTPIASGWSHRQPRTRSAPSPACGGGWGGGEPSLALTRKREREHTEYVALFVQAKPSTL